MAPPGPGPATTSVTTRTTRSGSMPNSRGGARGRGGGIQKRRGGTPKIDRDGDLVMDAVASTSGGKPPAPKNGHGAGTGGRGGRLIRAAATKTVQGVIRGLGSEAADLASRVPKHLRGRGGPTTVIKVLGLKESKAATNTDGGERTLLEFLERKASKDKKVIIKKSLLLGDFVYILVSKDDAQDILRLNDYTYAGAKLTITESQEPWPGVRSETNLSGEAQQAKEALRNVLSARYDVNRKLLDLSSLGTDPKLNDMGIFKETEKSNLLEKAFKALLIVCDQQFTSPQAKRDSIPSITLANNNISHVTQIFDLAETFPDLKNLDLSNNQIDSLRKLGRWRNRFRSLETLILIGNPIVVAEPSYKMEVLEWFPKLQILDGNQVRTPEQIQAAEAASRPTPIPQSGFDFRDASGVGEQFVKQFFTMYDTNRQQLASTFYDENSTFSLAVLTHAPRDHNNSPVMPWHAYMKFSRNLTKITTSSAREQRLFKGAPVIYEMWKILPATKHPSIETETEKYIIDCHVLTGLQDPSGQSPHGVDGLILTVHGEFDEIDSSTNKAGNRSFSRSFVLGPGLPGKQPVRVVSDMLALRAWNPVPAVVQAQTQVQAAPQVPSPVPTQGQAPTSSEVEKKRQMVIELSRRTSMTLPYSERCLNEVHWDFNVALQAFERNKGKLPAEAFGPVAAT